jgi:hypothetical protein
MYNRRLTVLKDDAVRLFYPILSIYPMILTQIDIVQNNEDYYIDFYMKVRSHFGKNVIRLIIANADALVTTLL